MVLAMFAPSCHVALEENHHTFGNLEFAFLPGVFASSSIRVMTKGITPFLATHVTKLQLCKTLPTSTVMLTVMKQREIIANLLTVRKTECRLG